MPCFDDETLQAKMALNIRPSEFNGLPENTLKHLHSAYLLLKAMRNVGVSPIPKLKRKGEKPIFIPAFENVDRMIEEAPVREKIAFILASVIGLRISEILALDYSDIQGEYLNISKHVTRNGVIEGLKADVQRLLPMPKGLLSLLDKNKFGLHEPLIVSQSVKRLSLNYSTTGIVKELLEKFRIGKFHNLRHFAAVRLIKKRNDIHVISKMLVIKTLRPPQIFTVDFQGQFLS
ncbi:site-specific integrase [Candidatus Arsenophonus triatominarum]|uniref:site-specific integrase n=1 Tax=Candidatus Arsenophonus triatominarum TaxID=57911 RepID=UPI0007C491F6|nr:site-specific integrase [Candidatus Arsenophonus triatominarum]